MTGLFDPAALVSAVPDPELPFLTIADLGILRSVVVDGGTVRVAISPTYSGCPALDSIRADVERTLRDNGFSDVVVETVLAPPWTTDWISDRGRALLAEHGIAPPGRLALPLLELSAPGGARTTPPADNPVGVAAVACPQCGSEDTELLSRFGSTACKALWRCRTCREPFEHVKAH